MSSNQKSLKLESTKYDRHTLLAFNWSISPFIAGWVVTKDCM